MSPERPLVPALDEIASVVKSAASEALQGAKDRQAPRGGPLQAVGRLYAILATLAAVASGVGAYIDHTSPAADLHWSTWLMRCAFLLVVAVGTFGGAAVVWVLVKSHPYLLSSPTEVSPETGAAIADSLSSSGKKEKQIRDDS
jgi:hypothetical protein